MKTFELVSWIGFAIAGMVGQFAVLLFHWEPGAHITAAVAFTALMFAANGRYWQARRDHIKPHG